jgi:hypothetical protein
VSIFTLSLFVFLSSFVLLAPVSSFLAPLFVSGSTFSVDSYHSSSTVSIHHWTIPTSVALLPIYIYAQKDTA